MKKFSKIIAVMLCAVTALASLAACGGDDPSKLDPTTTLYVANYDGAAGHTWLDYYIAEYKKVQPNVTIVPMNKKEEFSGDKVMSTMANDIYDIYFTDHSAYSAFVASGVIADMTDIVTEKVYTDDGELAAEGAGTKSIIDFLYPEMREYYAVGSGESVQYYGLPTFYPISGAVYDADLFNQKNWFFDKNGNIGVKDSDPNVGPGPDGKFETTADNGEPETWEQFMTLLSTIRGSGNVTPFTWSGSYYYQRQYYMQSLAAQYEGKNDYDLWYTLNGTDSTLGEITEENGYVLFDQPGVKASVQAVYDVVSNSDNYSKNAFLTGTQSHTAAEEEFVYSVETNDRIAMLLESSYWENEARGVFNSMEEISEDYAYGKRNFRMMNAPRLGGSTNSKRTYFGDASTKFIMVSANSKRQELAKDFIQFIHTRKNLAAFTTISGTFRPFDYVITEEEKATATPFMQNLMDKVLDANSEVVIAEDYSGFLQYASFGDFRTGAKFDKNETIEAMIYFKDHREITVDDYFNGMKALTSQSVWKNNYDAYKALQNK